MQNKRSNAIHPTAKPRRLSGGSNRKYYSGWETLNSCLGSEMTAFWKHETLGNNSAHEIV